MGVKIADKLEQFNNGTYYLVDSSAVEYVDKDGNSQSVKDVLDNGIGEGNTTDLTDIENRITTNETNITGLQEQIDNLDIPEDVDLTEINDKLTELENKQINKSYITRLATSGTGYFKIKPCGQNTFSKILITDVYGGCILITGSLMNDNSTYSFKVVRLSNGSWVNSLPSNNTLNKILNVYNDGSYIYLTVASYVNLYIEGGFINTEKIESIPTEATELPILDLTQAASKRVYNSLEELNTAKGLSISFTNGEDNTMKIVDALSPIETFADYFDNSINSNRFGIDTNTYGIAISLLSITKFNSTITIIRAYMSNGKLLIRRYQNGVLGDWRYDKTDLSEVNTKLSQLETKANLIPVVADNPTDYDLNNYKENGNYSIGSSDNYTNRPESSPGLLTVIRSNTYRLQLYTVVTNNNVYFRRSTDWGKTWSAWVLLNGSSGASGNGHNYSTNAVEVGTWVGGQTLYRITLVPNKTITVSSTSEGSVVTEVLGYVNTQYQVVKMEGVFKYNNSSTSKICTIPCTMISDNMQINIVHGSTGDIVFQGKNVPVCNLTDIAVSVYYYKK